MASAAVEPRREANDSRQKRRQEESPDRSSSPPKERRKDDDAAVPDADSRRAKNAEALLGRTGGVYIPPAKLAAMRREIKDKSSEEYQKLTWEALKKSLNGLINKVNVSNLRNIIAEVFEENLVRGRGLLCRAVMKAQAASPSFTHVYAALIAIINTKLPEIGELLLKRVITQFKKSYRRNDKVQHPPLSWAPVVSYPCTGCMCGICALHGASCESDGGWRYPRTAAHYTLVGEAHR
jgi:pre-mRNA-splicing factor CWC22